MKKIKELNDCFFNNISLTKSIYNNITDFRTKYPIINETWFIYRGIFWSQSLWMSIYNIYLENFSSKKIFYL
jgi:hypothetical protein